MSIDEIMTTGENWSTQRKTDLSVTLPKILHWLAWDPNWASVMKSQWLATSAMVQPWRYEPNRPLCTGGFSYLLTYLLTPLSRVLLQELTSSQLVKKFPHFMEPEGSLPHLQVPATCPYPQPDQSNTCPPFHFLKIHLNIILPSTRGSSASVM